VEAVLRVSADPVLEAGGAAESLQPGVMKQHAQAMTPVRKCLRNMRSWLDLEKYQGGGDPSDLNSWLGLVTRVPPAGPVPCHR